MSVVSATELVRNAPSPCSAALAARSALVTFPVWMVGVCANAHRYGGEVV
jgi:hypothetical protein